jgi:hypothetical protein
MFVLFSPFLIEPDPTLNHMPIARLVVLRGGVNEATGVFCCYEKHDATPDSILSFNEYGVSSFS